MTTKALLGFHTNQRQEGIEDGHGGYFSSRNKYQRFSRLRNGKGECVGLERFADPFKGWICSCSIECRHLCGPYVSPVLVVADVKAVIVGFLAIQGCAV